MLFATSFIPYFPLNVEVTCGHRSFIAWISKFITDPNKMKAMLPALNFQHVINLNPPSFSVRAAAYDAHNNEVILEISI